MSGLYSQRNSYVVTGHYEVALATQSGTFGIDSFSTEKVHRIVTNNRCHYKCTYYREMNKWNNNTLRIRYSSLESIHIDCGTNEWNIVHRVHNEAYERMKRIPRRSKMNIKTQYRGQVCIN